LSQVNALEVFCGDCW